MPFECPDCRAPAGLEITLSLELPPDSRSDEIAVQCVECSRCGFRAAAVYEESRRGAWDTEARDHTGYEGGQMPQITWADFEKVEMRVGRVLAVEGFPEARKPAYKLTLDFGPYGLRRSSAQITNYTQENLVGRLIVAVTNFPPKRIGAFESEVLVLGAIQADGTVILLHPDEGAEVGSRIA